MIDWQRRSQDPNVGRTWGWPVGSWCLFPTWEGVWATEHSPQNIFGFFMCENEVFWCIFDTIFSDYVMGRFLHGGGMSLQCSPCDYASVDWLPYLFVGVFHVWKFLDFPLDFTGPENSWKMNILDSWWIYWWRSGKGSFKVNHPYSNWRSCYLLICLCV